MTLVVSLLGEPAIEVDGTLAPLASRKQRQVLASLALRHGARRSTASLIDDLWGDSPPETARKNVQVLIGKLRSRVGRPHAIPHIDDGYALDATQWQFAHAQFGELQREARRFADQAAWSRVLATLDAALAMWRGSALGALSDEPWAMDAARSLDQQRRDASLLRNEARIALGRHSDAVVELTQLAVEHPSELKVRSLLVRGLFHMGRQADALEVCRAGLESARARGVVADVDRLRAIERSLLAQSGEFGQRRGPALPSIPKPRDPLLGRDSERAGIRDQVLYHARLTTIVGPGGTGKTRLATAIAHDILGDRDIAWVDLSPAASRDDVLSALLNAFAITSVGADPVNALVQAIGGRSMCVVLDNLEQVIDSADVVVRLREACPELRILATSRIALGVPGEVVVRLSPLQLADDADGIEESSLRRLDAVRLFLDRAARVDGVMPLDAGTIRDVHRICRHVDGLPLGIELAAARTRLLSPQQILAQLDHSFALVASGSLDRPERHRSLTDVIAWSYELLDERGRHGFRVASLFVGACDTEDFRRVAKMSLDEAVHVLHVLAANSLVVHEHDMGGSGRWRMLGTIAAFGRDRLAEVPSGPAVRSRFAECMVDHAVASNTYVARDTGAEQRFILERANVHAAFDWAIEHAPERAADIFIGMDRYLHTRGSMFEGDELGRRLHALIETVELPQRSLVLGLAGRMAHYRGDDERSSLWIQQALELAVSSGQRHAELRILVWYVERLRMVGDTRTAMEYAESAVKLATELGDEWHLGLARSQLGFALSDLEDPDRGRVHFTDAEQLFRELGDAFWVENVVANRLIADLFDTLDASYIDELAQCEARIAQLECWTYAAHVESYRLRGLLEVGNFEDAATCATALIPRVRETGEAMLLMFTLACASVAYMEVDRAGEARECAHQSLELAVESAATMFVEYSLGMLACAMHDAEDPRAAWVASFIDMKSLDGIYQLDRHVMRKLVDVTEEPVDPAGTDEASGRLAQLRHIATEVTATDA
ncbi:MAG: family transcriptional regulator [Thermoleophilia bacterium]|nr:family transcriptional regulator [Thermoleophilia bacterium]